MIVNPWRLEGPTKIITDLRMMEPDPLSKELAVVSVHTA
jgi:hypothetical protein